MTTRSFVLDRRAFLGGMGFAAGAVVATSLVPLSVVHALPSGEVQGTWHVDDMCGHWPPYSHPIGYGHVATEAASLMAHADPIDHIFLA